MGRNYYTPIAYSMFRTITPPQAVHLNNPGILKSVLNMNINTMDKHYLLCLLEQAKNTKKDESITVIEKFMFVI